MSEPPSRTTPNDEQLRARVRDAQPDVEHMLRELVRIPSVSAPNYPPQEVRRSAEAVAGMLRTEGVQHVRLLELPGAHPAVYGRIDVDPGAPTVMLYAHHDVQPPGPDSEWDGDPFVPSVRDGRMYGRGASDDKAGIAMHLGALRAFHGQPPVNLVFLIEGEEEVGSEHAHEFLDTYADLLQADVVVIADAGNWGVGQPALTTSLRGIVACVLEVKTAELALHSGSFGGVLPDALSALSHVLASLHRDDGSVAVAVQGSDQRPDRDFDPAEMRELTQPVPGLVLGERFAERLWYQPAISVLAIDAPPVSEAINQLVPVARAKVSMRIPPGQDVGGATQLLSDHLRAAVPWGAELELSQFECGAPFQLPAESRAMAVWEEAMSRAWGCPVVQMGEGGAIPIVAAFRQLLPEAELVLVGPGDPTSAIHAPNESQHLQDLELSIFAQALALLRLAEGWQR